MRELAWVRANWSGVMAELTESMGMREAKAIRVLGGMLRGKSS
jgi:hypothetical protein